MITDVRFKNEVEHIKAHFGDDRVTAVRINRFKECKHTDPSERELDDYERFDLTIQNNSSLDSFLSQVDLLCGLPRLTGDDLKGEFSKLIAA